MSRTAKVALEAVVGAALRVADTAGLEGVTIRAVAAEAGLATMSLYTHVASKDELLDSMARELSRLLYGASEQQTWQAALLASCKCMREVLLAHPNWVPLLARPAPAADLPTRERLLKQMTTAGFTPTDALTHVAHAGLLTLSLTLLELQYRLPEGTSVFARRFEVLRTHAAQEAFATRSPLTRLALSAMPPLDLGATLTATLAAFIKGIEPAPGSTSNPPRNSC